MGYTDKHGRPELIAQPFISRGTADPRVVELDAEAGDAGDQDERTEPVAGAFVDDDDDPRA